MIEPVSVHVVIASPPEAVWPYLTVDALVGRWFADCTFSGDDTARSFRFEFGDGDYFTGDVTEWREAAALGLTWRFMGVGPTYAIRYELAPCEVGTRVTVSDRGALSAAEAESLREGWTDFLARLEKAVTTRQVARYEWSETISATALVGEAGDRVLALVGERSWWEARFPGADLTLARIPHGVGVDIREPGWRGASTRADITIVRQAGVATVQVRHDGWARLPVEQRVAERRRAARMWAATLADLETTAAN